MAKDEAPTDSIKADDAIFMAECLKHLQTPANVRTSPFLTHVLFLSGQKDVNLTKPN